jgi:murein hydrolase activator
VTQVDRHLVSAPRRSAAVRTAVSLWSAASLLLLAVVAAFAQQADRASTEALALRATERLRALQREADQLASQERTILNDLRRLEVERQIKIEDLRRVTAEADQVQSELTSTTERINELEQQDLAERPDVSARMVDMYKLGRARYLRLLLSTSDVRQLGRATRMVAALAELDRERLASHQRTLDSLKAARNELEERGRRLQALRSEAERADAATASAARARSDLIRDIDQRRDLNARLAGELQAAQEKLQLALRDLSNGGGVAQLSPLPLRPFRGSIDWPVVGSLRRRFAPGLQGTSAGIEIAAVEGTPVHAIHEGTVAFADSFSGFGNLVILDHGDQVFSLYGDLLEIAVKRGSRVERGQPIGNVGSSPAGAVGLYFELRVDGRPVDPLEWLRER